MSLSIAKLKVLWKNPPTPDGSLEVRWQQIEDVVKKWDDCWDSAPDFHPHKSSETEGFPTNNWNQVKGKFRDYYQAHSALQGWELQIEEVSALFHLQSRDPRFRVSSNAAGESDHESETTIPMRSNPESFLTSYNFPFQLVRFYHDCRGGVKTDALSWVRPRRFNVKFLWMLANRSQCLPILSLQSLRAIVSLLSADQRNIEKMTLDAFAEVWLQISEMLCREITGMGYAESSEDQKKRLWRLVFLASVQATSAKNAFDMLKMGNRALIFYGPPGTGKTYHAKQVAAQMLGLPGASGDDLTACQFTKVRPGTNVSTSLERGNWELIQFHPSYSYQDFIGGILPCLEGGSLSYKLNEGVFMRFCKAAAKHPEKLFVLIIDEINRADLSSVFGELMYALEYRGETVQVPHFGGFSIPKNVYLIGTMNTADKSLVSFGCDRLLMLL